jgi:hypothetical protein
MTTRMKIITSLIMLGIIDMVVPIPILGIILLYVVMEKPPWFRRAVRDVYNEI